MAPQNFTPNQDTKRTMWVFGYGSLVWKPDFEFTSRKIGFIKGFVRRFWQGNVTHRGVPERPGRVCTLVKEESGSTWGVSFKLEGEDQIMAAAGKLNTRECVLGGYITHHLPVMTTDGETHVALVYLATPDCEFYMGPNKTEAMAKDIVSSHGPCGSNTEYLFRLADFMRESLPWVEDPHLYELDEATRKLLKCNNCSPHISITPPCPSSTRTENEMSSASSSSEMPSKGHPDQAIQSNATQVLI